MYALFYVFLSNILLVFSAPEPLQRPVENVKKVPKIEDLKDPLTLKFVFVVMRNGESFPDEYMIKTNPSYEWKHYKFPRGELTKLGRFSMYEAGENLRYWYPEFLSRSYVTKHLVKVTAVGSEFTINSRESALLVRAALRLKNKKRSLERKWSTRKLASTRNDEFTDAASDYYHKCKKYRLEQNNALAENLTARIKTEENFKELWETLKNNTEANLDYKNLTTLQYLFDLYETSEMSGIGLPHWLHGEKWHTYYHLMDGYVNASYPTDYLKTVAGGRMLQYFFDRMEDKFNGKLEPCDTRMLVNVGYDKTVSSFLAVLGGNKGFTHSYELDFIEEGKNGTTVNETVTSFRPFFGGMVIVEAHQLDGDDDIWIRVFVSTSANSPISELIINGCTYPCSYQELKKNLESLQLAVNMQNWVKACNEGPDWKK